MTGPRALRAGPGAARALRAGGAGRVEVVLGGGGYLSLGPEGWVLLAPPRAPHGPLSLHVAGLAPLEAGAPASVQEDALVVGEQRAALDGMRVQRTGALALRPVDRPTEALRPGIDALARGEVVAAIALLAGRGEGLTPAGDDVLAGYVGWMAAVGTPVAVADAAAERTTALSLAYLRCAERGELPAAADLRRWGASSGRALMWGMDAAARRSRARPAPASRSAPGAPSAPR